MLLHVSSHLVLPAAPKVYGEEIDDQRDQLTCPKAQLVYWKGAIGPHVCLILKPIYFLPYQWQILPQTMLAGAPEFRSFRIEFLNCRLQVFKCL